MSAEREIAAEDSIRVVCRFRPLNDSEEKAGSKVIVKFPNTPEENCISIGVSFIFANAILHIINFAFDIKLSNGNIAMSSMGLFDLFALNVYSSVSLV